MTLRSYFQTVAHLGMLAMAMAAGAPVMAATVQDTGGERRADDIVLSGAGTFRPGLSYSISHLAQCLAYTTRAEVEVNSASFKLRSLSVDGIAAPLELLRRVEQEVTFEGIFKYIAVICNDGADVRIYFVTNFSDHDRDDNSVPVVAIYHPDTWLWD